VGGGHAGRIGKLKLGNHTEPRLTAQAIVFACENNVTSIGDSGFYAWVLLRRL
jgi:hypothetical protein